MNKKKMIKLSNLLEILDFDCGVEVKIYDADECDTHIGSYYRKNYSFNYGEYFGDKEVEAKKDEYAVIKISKFQHSCEIYITDDFKEEDIVESINLETISSILPNDEALTCFSLNGQIIRFAYYEQGKFLFLNDDGCEIDPIDIYKSHLIIKFLMECPIRFIDMDYEYYCLALNYNFDIDYKTTVVITK